MRVSYLFLGVFLLPFVASQRCDDATIRYSKYGGKRDDYPVCIHIDSGFEDTNAAGFIPKQQYFWPVVDEYSLIQAETELPCEDYIADILLHPLTIRLQAGGIFSAKTVWLYGNRTVPYFTAIIHLKDGQVTEITWESNCFGCSDGSQCTSKVWNDALGANNGFCSQQGCASNGDIKVFLAWVGTDSSGNFLTSAGSTMSNFRRFSAYKAYEDFVKKIPSELGI